MLSFVLISMARPAAESFQEFNPQTETWVLSDLKSKQEIQIDCYKKYGFYTDDSILRMSDFWKLWTRRLFPHLSLVNDDFIESLVRSYVDLYKEKLNLEDNVAQTLTGLIRLAAPIMLNEGSRAFMHEWSQQNPDKRWIYWYKIAQSCLRYIVEEKKVASAKWLPSLLLNADIQKIIWPKKLKIELGAQVSAVEMSLLKEMAKLNDIEIHVPQPKWKNHYFYLLKNYDTFLNFGPQRKIQSKPQDQGKKIFLKATTQLAEVKFVISQVRNWIEAGHQPHEIAIISPNIEEYWPLIEDYGRIEGLPFNKDRVAPLGSLSLIQSLLSHMQSLTADVSFESLQQRLFQGTQQWPLKFEKFKSLFAQLYDVDDLKRDSTIENLFYRKLDLSQNLSRVEFISLVTKIWLELPQENHQSLLFETIVKDFLSQSIETHLKMNEWHSFFKQRLSSKETKIAEADANGIHLVSLPSAQLLETPFKIYIGLVDELLKSKSSPLIPLQDIEELKKSADLDFVYPEESQLEFDLRWFSELPAKETYFCAAEFSFQSDPLNACLFFLENHKDHLFVEETTTRLDQLQVKARMDLIDGAPEATYSTKRLQMDYQQAPITVATGRQLEFSVSDLENYAKCPFIWLAQKGFSLREDPELAIDLHPMQKGTIVHAVLEHVMKDLNAVSEQSLEPFLDAKRKELDLYRNSDIYWSVQKKKLIELAFRFKKFEQSIQRPTASRSEVPFEIYFDTELKEFTVSPSTNGLKIKGRIDRIDQYGEQFIIYDYKGSTDGRSNFGDWVDESEFQLLLYMIALRFSLKPGQSVAGALYYSYKTFQRDKGYVVSDLGQTVLNLSNKKGCVAKDDELISIEQSMTELLNDLISHFKFGNFSTTPKDENKNCKACDWNTLCRAQHLN